MPRHTMPHADWRTPQQRAAVEADVRRDREEQRALCDGLQFWRICELRQCKRRHACAGNAHDCFAQNFRRMDEDLKVWIRAAATASKSGLPLPEAHRIANAERAQFLAQQAAQLAMSAVAAPPPTPADAPAPSPVTAAHAPAAPRVRSL